MSRKKSVLVCAIESLLTLLIISPPAGAQTITTGTLSGIVRDQQGGVLPGATVTATHEPTGTKYEAVSGADGRYVLPNVRVGGPYTVTAALAGFKDKTESDVNVALGADRTVEFKLALATISETVTVVASAPDIDTTRAGTADNISTGVIESLPTIQRGIFDFARTSPYFNLSPDSANNDASISVAGRNNRYNSMQIDGAVNNDVFGLAAQGTPGGQTGTQPISLDAIQEIQLVVAPYDVRQGGFSGGGVNAVTRSGTNAFSGTAYYFGRNQGLVGTIPSIATVQNPSPADAVFGDFSDRQGGFSVGGPMNLNKAFFFTNLDWARKSVPVGFSVSGTSGQPWNHQAEVQQIVNIAKTQYGYDTGGLDEVSPPTDSNKFFLRTDFNISTHNQLIARVNYVNGTRQLTSAGVPSTTIYALPGDYYQIQDKVIAPVGQLNTTWNRALNEFRVTYQRERNKRTNPGFETFPYVRVDLPDATNVRLGTENSSHANELDQDIAEITDDVTLLRGQHTITVGTHNEFFKFRNLFIQNLYGNYEFLSIEAFQAGLAQLYQVGYSNTSDPQQAARFSVRQFGVYAGDQWRARSNLTLTYGVRLDAPNFPDKPTANP
ncbi:MAG: TonB-dependent receptor, partial [Blastocatellia bacterium]